MAFLNDAEYTDDFRSVGPDATAGFAPAGSAPSPVEHASSEHLELKSTTPDDDLDEEDEVDEDDDLDEDDDDLEDDDDELVDEDDDAFDDDEDEDEDLEDDEDEDEVDADVEGDTTKQV